MRSRRPTLLTALYTVGLAVALGLAACGDGEPSPVAEPTVRSVSSDVGTVPAALTPTPTTTPSQTQLATTSTTSTSTSTSTTSTTTAPTSTTTTAVLPDQSGTDFLGGFPVDLGDLADPLMTETNAAFDRLARDNAAASLTVQRNGVVLVSRASGILIDGTAATADSPMLVASVSKVITALSIAKLEQQGVLAVTQPMPWESIGIPTHPAWAGVTIRELLDHTSGMPVVRSSWFDGQGDCRSFLPSLVAAAPERSRGAWRYSNGNYCALGLLVEALTALPLDAAAQHLLFDPLGRDGVHLSTNGLLPTDVPHARSVERLSRLGGAGTFVVSTDDLAAMMGAVFWADYTTLQAPGVHIDQYGWGHTGTVEGAVSCVWLLDDGQTAVAATIAGQAPNTGGGVCDRVVPAVANDVGIGQGRPKRTP